MKLDGESAFDLWSLGGAGLNHELTYLVKVEGCCGVAFESLASSVQAHILKFALPVFYLIH